MEEKIARNFVPNHSWNSCIYREASNSSNASNSKNDDTSRNANSSICGLLIGKVALDAAFAGVHTATNTPAIAVAYTPAVACVPSAVAVVCTAANTPVVASVPTAVACT
jgi:hypothetical protein